MKLKYILAAAITLAATNANAAASEQLKTSYFLAVNSWASYEALKAACDLPADPSGKIKLMSVLAPTGMGMVQLENALDKALDAEKGRTGDRCYPETTGQIKTMENAFRRDLESLEKVVQEEF